MHASVGERNGNPFQCSCLENPRDGGARWAAIYGVAQSQIQLKWLSSSSSNSRFFIAFLWRSKSLLILWLQSPSMVILEPKKINSVIVLTFLPSICHEVMGPDAMIFIFWMLSFKAAFSLSSFQFSSVQFSHSVMSDSLRPHESQYTRPPCPSPSPRVHSDSCPSSPWYHPAISSSVIPFSSYPQSLPAAESFPMSQLFAWGGQSIGISASASLLPKKSQGWSPLGWTGWISLQSKGLSRVFSNTTVQKHQFFSVQPTSESNSHIHTWPLEKP